MDELLGFVGQSQGQEKTPAPDSSMDNVIFSPLRVDEILGFREPQARATTPPVNSSTRNILPPPIRADEILGITTPQPREITPSTEKSPHRIRGSYDPPKPHKLPERPS